MQPTPEVFARHGGQAELAGWPAYAPHDNMTTDHRLQTRALSLGTPVLCLVRCRKNLPFFKQ